MEWSGLDSFCTVNVITWNCCFLLPSPISGVRASRIKWMSYLQGRKLGFASGRLFSKLASSGEKSRLIIRPFLNFSAEQHKIH
jgi:hypothetical protein